MILFKIKNRKVWHIATGRNTSFCRNAVPFDVNRARGYYSHKKDREYAEKYDNLGGGKNGIDEDFVSTYTGKEIPKGIHGSICKACVMHAFDNGEVRIVSTEKEGKNK